MAELGLSIVGLAGLFTTCLEGYRICLSVSSANKDSKLLRMRVYLERERFLNIGRTCGLVEHRGVQGSRQALQQFLDEDDYRRRAIGEILDLIATLLSEAETLDRKYATLEIAAPPSDDNVTAMKANLHYTGLTSTSRMTQMVGDARNFGVSVTCQARLLGR